MQALVPADIRRLEALLAAAGRVCIAVHTHPDGDALGSGTALLAYLRLCRGVEARLLLPDPAPDSLDFLLASDGVLTAADPLPARTWIAESDLIFCLDMNGFSRAESLEAPLRESRARKVLIDHHQHPDREAFDLVFSETEISSASELLYHVLLALPGVGAADRLPLQVLTPLMAGMTTDTNNFANSVYPSTFRMASELIAAGVDRDALLEKLYRSYRENRVRLMGYMQNEGLRLLEEGAAYMILTKALQDRFDLRDGESEGLVNVPLTIGKVRLSVLLKEDGDHFRVSVRSKKGTSAQNLAQRFFHGGGHENAAGGKLFPGQDFTPGKADEHLRQILKDYLR